MRSYPVRIAVLYDELYDRDAGCSEGLSSFFQDAARHALFIIITIDLGKRSTAYHGSERKSVESSGGTVTNSSLGTGFEPILKLVP